MESRKNRRLEQLDKNRILPCNLDQNCHFEVQFRSLFRPVLLAIDDNMFTCDFGPIFNSKNLRFWTRSRVKGVPFFLNAILCDIPFFDNKSGLKTHLWKWVQFSVEWGYFHQIRITVEKGDSVWSFEHYQLTIATSGQGVIWYCIMVISSSVICLQKMGTQSLVAIRG